MAQNNFHEEDMRTRQCCQYCFHWAGKSDLNCRAQVFPPIDLDLLAAHLDATYSIEVKEFYKEDLMGDRETRDRFLRSVVVDKDNQCSQFNRLDIDGKLSEAVKLAIEKLSTENEHLVRGFFEEIVDRFDLPNWFAKDQLRARCAQYLEDNGLIIKWVRYGAFYMSMANN